MKLEDVLLRPVAFHRVLAEVAGTVGGGVFLSQAVYWSSRTTDPARWFHKSAGEWNEETAIRQDELTSIRARLQKLGIIEYEVRGLPAKGWYRVNMAALEAAVEAAIEARKLVSGIPETVLGDPQNLDREFPKHNTETTAETTAERSSPKASTKPPARQRKAAIVPEVPEEQIAISLPITGTPDEYPITHGQVAEWAQLFPAVDVPQELRNMRAWCSAHRERRKTPGGVLRFVVGWLTKEQNQGGRFRGAPPPRQPTAPAKVYRQG